MAAACTGVGVTNPAASSLPCKFRERGSSVNAFNSYLFLLAETDRSRGTRYQSRMSVHDQDALYAEGTEGVKGGESQISLKALKEPATHNRIKREISIAQGFGGQFLSRRSATPTRKEPYHGLKPVATQDDVAPRHLRCEDASLGEVSGVRMMWLGDVPGERMTLLGVLQAL